MGVSFLEAVEEQGGETSDAVAQKILPDEGHTPHEQIAGEIVH